MNSRLKRGLLSAMAALGLAMGSAAGAPAAQAAPLFDQSQWVQGTPGWNSKLICIYTCQTYTIVMNNVSFQGPIGNISAVPKVGERFYLHVYTAVVGPASLDSYRMQLLLPEGLKTDIRSDTDVVCAITDSDWNPTRTIGPAECQDPVKVGVYEQFPAVALNEGEAISFTVPVVADRTFNQSTTIGLVSDLVTNPSGLLPDPLWATNTKLVVNPAPSQPGTGGGGGTGTGGTGTGGTPGTGGSGGSGSGSPSQTTLSLPTKLKGAKAIKSTTPKVCKVTGKGKKAKVVKIKKGKCKLVGTKNGKTVKAKLKLT